MQKRRKSGSLNSEKNSRNLPINRSQSSASTQAIHNMLRRLSLCLFNFRRKVMTAYGRSSGFRNFGMFPPVMKWLLIIDVSVFLFEFLLQMIVIEQTPSGAITMKHVWIEFMALWPIGADSWGTFYPWQLLTYQFMHGNFFHILFNMFVLWMFGMELEEAWGSARFLIFYLTAGVGAGLAQLFITPAIVSMFSPEAHAGWTVGASGSIYGLLVGFAMTHPDRKVFMFPLFIPISAKYLVWVLVAIGLLMGLGNRAGDNVAHFAHLGGAAMGFLLYRFGDKTGYFKFFENLFRKTETTRTSNFYKPPPKKAKIYQADWTKKEEPSQTRTQRKSGLTVDGEDVTQARIDEILDKISSAGYQSLTDREKKILFELSQKLR